jgi:peptide-methionine (S)-S-oxide reductase
MNHKKMLGKNLEVATLGGGCFWCVEAVYLQIDGIEKVVSGYAGGYVSNPTYRQVCSKTTGHAEVIQITYDANKLNFEEIMEIFWHSHNPTTPNQQGNDKGPEYRSIILYHDEAQKEIAEKSVEETNKAGLWENPIVTEVEPLKEFYTAEAVHQNYYNLNEYQPYCSYVIAPKIRKIREKYAGRLKD